MARRPPERGLKNTEGPQIQIKRDKTVNDEKQIVGAGEQRDGQSPQPVSEPELDNKVSSFKRGKPTSEKKTQANRRNARRSTGPRTARGKRIASRNSTKHGLCAADVVNPDLGENIEDFRRFHEKLIAEYEPIGEIENLLVKEIVSLLWRRKRVQRAENGEIIQAKVAAEKRNLAESDRLSMRGVFWTGEKEVWALMRTDEGLRRVLGVVRWIRDEIAEKGSLASGMRDLSKRLSSLGCIYLSGLDEKLDQKKNKVLDIEERKDSLCQIDWEINRLEDRQTRIAALEKLDQESEILASSIPSTDSRVLRYETHIDRLLHRTMLQLERVQNRRKGEPVPTEIARLPRKSPAGYSSASPEASVMTQTTK